MNIRRFLFLTLFACLSSSAWGEICNTQQEIKNLYETFATQCQSTSYEAAAWLTTKKDCIVKLVVDTLTKKNCLPIPRPDEDTLPYFIEYKDGKDKRTRTPITSDLILKNAPITVGVMYTYKTYKPGTIITPSTEKISYTPQPFQKEKGNIKKSEYRIDGSLNLLYTYSKYEPDDDSYSYTNSDPVLTHSSYNVQTLIDTANRLSSINDRANRYLVILSLCPDKNNVCDTKKYDYYRHPEDRAMIWKKL